MSTLAPSATLSSSSSCTTGLMPDLAGGSARTCAVGVYSTRHSVDDAVDAMRSCCGSSAINILDGGCVLSCEAGSDTQDCLVGKIRGVECSGGSTVVVSSGGGGGSAVTSSSGSDSTSGSGNTIISGGDGTTISAGPSGTTVTSSTESTGAAPLMKMDFATKGGAFVAGLLAMGFVSGTMLL